MIVPTVPATTARRNCRLCSASERALAAIPVVVIECAPLPLIGCVLKNRRRLKSVVFLRDVLVGVVGQQRRRGNADDCAAKDVQRDRKARTEGGEQRSRDKRRGA